MSSSRWAALRSTGPNGNWEAGAQSWYSYKVHNIFVWDCNCFLMPSLPSYELTCQSQEQGSLASFSPTPWVKDNVKFSPQIWALRKRVVFCFYLRLKSGTIANCTLKIYEATCLNQQYVFYWVWLSSRMPAFFKNKFFKLLIMLEYCLIHCNSCQSENQPFRSHNISHIGYLQIWDQENRISCKKTNRNTILDLYESPSPWFRPT